MPSLIVPIPTLSPLVPNTTGLPAESHFVIEMPLAVRSAAVTRPDGTVVSPAALEHSECLLCRQVLALDPVEVWDAAGRTWQPDGWTGPWVPMALDGATWRGVIPGSPDWPTSNKVTGFPAYFARTRFESRGDAATGTAESATIKLFSLAEKLRPEFAITPSLRSLPSTAGRFALVNDTDKEFGALVIDSAAPVSVGLEVRNSPGGVVVGRVNLSGGTVELTNAANASVRITAGGDVELNPGPGGSVKVNGVILP